MVLPSGEEAVKVTVDKTKYRSQIGFEDGRVLGEKIKIKIVNGSEKDIFFDDSFSAPLPSLFFEISKDGRCMTYNQMLTEGENTSGYTVVDWLKQAKRLKPGEAAEIEDSLDHEESIKIFAGFWRIKFQYYTDCSSPALPIATTSFFLEQQTFSCGVIYQSHCKNGAGLG